MSSYASPGVYVTESRLQENVFTQNFSASTAAFFGTAERGPTTPTFINSWNGFTSQFGSPSANYTLGFALYHYFSNGGRDAYVTRVVSSTEAVASGVVNYYPQGTDSASTSLFTASVKNPGSWGNRVSVQTLQGLVSATPTQLPTFALVISLDNQEVERWTELSPDPTSSRYAPTVVNNYSRYVTLTNFANVLADDLFEYDTEGTVLSGGATNPPAEIDYINALPLLDTIEGVLMINAVEQFTNSLVAAVIGKAKERGNSLAILDPSPDHTTASDFISEVTTYRTTEGSNFAVYCAPYLTMVDPSKSGPAALRKTAPGGAVAGLYARVEAERSVGKSPAGYTADIRNALGIEEKFTENEVGLMYDAGVNIFKTIPGSGIVLFGSRTLERVRPDRFVSVRRSLNYLKQALKDVTQFAVFEPNDERLWTSISSACGSVLSNFWAAGGLKGQSSTDAYYVKCDSSNNTPASIDNGEVRVEIGVALQQPAEFIVINISQWTGGSNAAESL